LAGLMETCKLAMKALDAIKAIPETESNPKFSDYYLTTKTKYMPLLPSSE